MSAVGELLRALTEPGDGVVVNPPVYPPFFSVTRRSGRRVVEAPLQASADGWRLDLDGLERGVRGRRARLPALPPAQPDRDARLAAEQLEAVAALAAEYGVTVVSDEVHAPMTMPGAVHLPYLSLGGDGRRARRRDLLGVEEPGTSPG